MRARRRSVVAVCAAAIVLLLGGGCGDDEETESPPQTGTTDTAVTAPADGEPDGTQQDDAADGAPQISDEGHVGGGPDPGTEEAEQAEQQRGGTPAGGDGAEDPVRDGDGDGSAGQGGTGPTGGPGAFERFCEQNPAACE